MGIQVLWTVLLVASFDAGLQAASIIMPEFSAVSINWAVDPSVPAGFGDVSTFEGRADILGITISTPDGLGVRPAPYESSIQDIQASGYALWGGRESLITAELFVGSSAPSFSGSGLYRKDVWGIMIDGTDIGDFMVASPHAAQGALDEWLVRVHE